MIRLIVGGKSTGRRRRELNFCLAGFTFPSSAAQWMIYGTVWGQFRTQVNGPWSSVTWQLMLGTEMGSGRREGGPLPSPDADWTQWVVIYAWDTGPYRMGTRVADAEERTLWGSYTVCVVEGELSGYMVAELVLLLLLCGKFRVVAF